ncbi:MAG: chorismate lyase [Methylotenera sp.]|uniref:chorismate--pyruvate lyase family protein n=1 Tax=Methylotenera sp. TaxID=2051956 RepID=UPI0024871593|nr:chorismate lyase [Methylotenera sp.]MDI1309041.1 chorismate lyase [Methylotenera sp.]
MKIQQNLASTRQRWLNKPIQANRLQAWLIDNGSLTARLQQRFSAFAVQPIAVKHAKLIQDEAVLLHQPNYQISLIREVLLIGNHQPVVFAHSVLPSASLRGAWNGLGRLGIKPLGATLFANPKVKRTALSYKKLTPNHALYQHATRHLTQNSEVRNPPYLWARRSIFSLSCANIMVTEVFLPQLMITENV